MLIRWAPSASATPSLRDLDQNTQYAIRSTIELRPARNRVRTIREVDAMYENILVPLDGSELAEQVLPHVQALAEKFGSTVTLLRATLSPQELVPPTGMSLPLGDAAAHGNVLTPGTIEDFD